MKGPLASHIPQRASTTQNIEKKERKQFTERVIDSFLVFCPDRAVKNKLKLENAEKCDNGINIAYTHKTLLNNDIVRLQLWGTFSQNANREMVFS